MLKEVNISCGQTFCDLPFFTFFLFPGEYYKVTMILDRSIALCRNKRISNR